MVITGDMDMHIFETIQGVFNVRGMRSIIPVFILESVKSLFFIISQYIQIDVYIYMCVSLCLYDTSIQICLVSHVPVWKFYSYQACSWADLPSQIPETGAPLPNPGREFNAFVFNRSKLYRILLQLYSLKIRFVKTYSENMRTTVTTCDNQYTFGSLLVSKYYSVCIHVLDSLQ